MQFHRSVNDRLSSYVSNGEIMITYSGRAYVHVVTIRRTVVTVPDFIRYKIAYRLIMGSARVHNGWDLPPWVDRAREEVIVYGGRMDVDELVNTFAHMLY